ncbi:MAG: alpha/beta hydrolase [Alphaproteobacteria bacterium]|nr:alpha/beta hydrolase [Alphaproteobacteria bacterium]
MACPAPSHPGFGGTPLPDWLDSVDDLSYLYLDLLDAMDLRNVTVLGFSLGGWIAAEMAVRCSARISGMVLVGAVGIKIGDRETRDFPDIYAIKPEEVTRLIYHIPGLAPDPAKMSEEELMLIARHRAAAALYLWEPYMHHPKLWRRLRRIDVPTLYIRGAHDGLVSQKYAEAYCAAIPGAQLIVMDDAGHVPEQERPDAFVAEINKFAAARQRAVT